MDQLKLLEKTLGTDETAVAVGHESSPGLHFCCPLLHFCPDAIPTKSLTMLLPS
jgi:hypothetical protein